MRRQRSVEIHEERNQRLLLEIQIKKDRAAADEALVDQMIRQSIAVHGP